MARKTITKGTRVKIEFIRHGTSETHTGTIISAVNWGSDEAPDWYIELKDDQTKYEYFKQQYDGLMRFKVEVLDEGA